MPTTTTPTTTETQKPKTSRPAKRKASAGRATRSSSAGSTSRSSSAGSASRSASRGRTRRASTRRSSSNRSIASGYSQTAEKLLSRGKQALGGAYEWAESAGRSLPSISDKIHMPSTRRAQSMMEDNPLMVGALGLGLGLALAAMMPLTGRSGSWSMLGQSRSQGSTRRRRGGRSKS